MARGPDRLAGDTLSEQNALDRVQTVEVPRPQELAQVVVEQPAIEECLVLLVHKEWPHYVAEELRVLLAEEEVELMASVFRVERAFFSSKKDPEFFRNVVRPLLVNK